MVLRLHVDSFITLIIVFVYLCTFQILCVHNGGLDNGVSQDDLHILFSHYGSVQDIIMIPRKPFCFVCYDSVEDAATAQEHVTGYLLREGRDPSQNVILFPFFVTSGE